MAVTNTVFTELQQLGLVENDLLVRYMKARKMSSLEVFRLAGHISCEEDFYDSPPS